MAAEALFADLAVELKLRTIEKLCKPRLALKILGTCATSLSAFKGLRFMWSNRDESGDLHYNNLVIHGPDSVFLYAATKYPGL
ncbi:hypothetical protein EKK58_04205 [Candidatus Dependentiae bacterium]|nr:MAG: hypothetical protein EKK58_04205 [Candidatus Dependentiae bacterium]